MEWSIQGNNPSSNTSCSYPPQRWYITKRWAQWTLDDLFLYGVYLVGAQTAQRSSIPPRFIDSSEGSDCRWLSLLCSSAGVLCLSFNPAMLRMRGVWSFRWTSLNKASIFCRMPWTASVDRMNIGSIMPFRWDLTKRLTMSVALFAGGHCHRLEHLFSDAWKIRSDDRSDQITGRISRCLHWMARHLSPLRHAHRSFSIRCEIANGWLKWGKPADDRSRINPLYRVCAIASPIGAMSHPPTHVVTDRATTTMIWPRSIVISFP